MNKKYFVSEEAGARLKKVIEKEMTISAFAEKMGVRRGTVYEWFKGGGMSTYHLANACELLNVSSDYILFGRTMIVFYKNDLPFSDIGEE